MEASFVKFEIVDAVHPKRLLERMNNFRKSKRFCDVKLVIDDREIQGHRTVLALGSPHLDEKLELKEDTINIGFETNYDVMTIIVDYMYTGCIKFTLEDAIDIWKSLEHLQMKSVLEIFEKYLMDNINDDNCIEMFVLSEELNHKELKNLTIAYMVKNLKIFTGSKMFKHLNKNQLETILDEATVCNEPEIIYDALINWLKFENDRKDYIENMMKFIKAKNLTPKFIRTSILNENYLKSDPAGRQWIVDSFLYDNSPIIQNDQILYIFSRLTTKNWTYEYGINEKCLMKKDLRPTLNFASFTKHGSTIYALGGEGELGVKNIGYKYDTIQKLWTKFTCPIGKICCGICTGNNKIYVIGGMSNLTAEKSCSIFDVVTGQVTSMGDMNFPRSYPGVTFYNSSVYVFGGYAKRTVFEWNMIIMSETGSQIDRYDTREGRWSTAGDILLHSRCSATLISNTIFCLECDSGKIIKYDPRGRGTTNIANHQGNSLASINEQLYLAHEEGIAKYDPYNNSWIEVLKEPLQRPVLVV